MDNTKHWRDLTKRDLKSLYRLKTCREIATLYGFKSDETVRKRLKTLGIERRPVGDRREFDPPADKLRRLYQKHSMRDISKIFGVGETAVWKRLKEHGIKLKGHEDGGHRKKVGRIFSAEHRASISNAQLAANRRGPNSVHWKGGITAADLVQRKSADASLWKRRVIANAGFKCQQCGREQGAKCEHCGVKVHLYAHHIKPWKSHPELRFDPSNGEALCSVCHDARHGRITE